MKLHDVIKCKCTDLNHQGLGVCKVDGFPLFVPDLLVGEEALVKITKLQKKFGYGEVKKHLSYRKPRGTDLSCFQSMWRLSDYAYVLSESVRI